MKELIPQRLSKDRSPDDGVQVVDSDLEEAEQELAAMSQRDEDAIDTLLGQRSEQMKNHWNQQLAAAKLAFREWQTKASEKGK